MPYQPAASMLAAGFFAFGKSGQRALLCTLLTKCKLSSIFDDICVILDNDVISVG